MSSKKEVPSSAESYAKVKELMNMLRKQGLFNKAIVAYENFLQSNPKFHPADDVLKICIAGEKFQKMLEKAQKQQPPDQEKIKWLQQKIDQCTTSANIVQPPRSLAAPEGIPETITMKRKQQQ